MARQSSDISWDTVYITLCNCDCGVRQTKNMSRLLGIYYFTPYLPLHNINRRQGSLLIISSL